ncbi:putative arabinan endo-1,5-alpha-L-arabinosidase A [Microdochium bolleyi]|uniref:Arabinan endo-1,5-alpha-L-arabinosidase n=1 Tax=Microdochium bolleyi TaxID=196109 RepID=A0A136IJW3_9PEZI|nr:putative arabinan endo-1,5-alpha-L-arabinosidase A [Microdochium bolleyi]
MLLPRLLSTLLLALLLPAHAVAQDYPPPGACSGACYTRDPALIKRPTDGKYFRFTTRDRITIQTATNIRGPWTSVGSVLARRSIINLPGNDVLWAPDIARVGGVYFLFYSVSTLGSKTSAIGYATSSTMDPGTWTDRGAILTSSDSSPYNAIDPNLYHSADGREVHLNWGSYWQGIYTQPLTISGTSARLTPGTSPKNIAYLPEGNHAQEGAFVYQKNGFYWLFMSRGKAGQYGDNPAQFPVDQAYRVLVCRGTTPTGPFVGKLGKSCLDGGGTLVYASQGNIFAPGGQGVWQDDVLGDVLYYHYFNRNIGYNNYDERFGWNQVKWIDGWPVAV